MPGNSYARWIEAYAGTEYRAAAEAALDTLDRLAEQRGGATRFQALQATFNTAVRLETAFWEMGWGACPPLQGDT